MLAQKKSIMSSKSGKQHCLQLTSFSLVSLKAGVSTLRTYFHLSSRRQRMLSSIGLEIKFGF